MYSLSTSGMPNYGSDILNITMHTKVVIHSMNAYVWCWSKIFGSLDEIPSVTMGSCKSKRSNCNTLSRSKVKSWSDHDVAHLHPLTDVSTKYQLPTHYGFRDIVWTRFYRSRSLQQGQRSNQGQTMTLHTYTP